MLSGKRELLRATDPTKLELSHEGVAATVSAASSVLKMVRRLGSQLLFTDPASAAEARFLANETSSPVHKPSASSILPAMPNLHIERNEKPKLSRCSASHSLSTAGGLPRNSGSIDLLAPTLVTTSSGTHLSTLENPVSKPLSRHDSDSAISSSTMRGARR